MDEIMEELRKLFKEAKDKSEFDFVLTLLNYRGIGTIELTSNLYEWFESIEFYKILYNTYSNKEKSRIALLIYSMFFENSDFYNIIGSLCKVKLGYKGSSYLFWKTKNNRLLGVSEKQEILIEILLDTNKNKLVGFFKNKFIKGIRNAFFHSAYSISQEDYIIHDSDPLIIDGFKINSININSFLFPLVDDVLIFFEEFKYLYISYFESYTENKIVKGKFPKTSDIIILGSAEGLLGFKIKNAVQFYGECHDSGIWYNKALDTYEGHNIQFIGPDIETIEINEKFHRYENKTDINYSNTEFFNFIEKIVDRNKSTELKRAIILLIKFGDAKYSKMQLESNPNKKAAFSNYILPFYQLAIDIGASFYDFTRINNIINSLKISNR